MAEKQVSDEDLGLDAEQHPVTGKWRYLWTSPGAAECLGVFRHATEAAARTEGRAFAHKQIAVNQAAAAARQQPAKKRRK